MSEIIIQDTPIAKLKIIEHKPNKDFRGFFSREFCQKKFSQLLEGKNIQQINRSLTKKKEPCVVYIFNFHHLQKLR